MLRLAIVFRTPPSVLKRILSSRDFAELIAYDQVFTLDPDGWQTYSRMRSFLANSFGGSTKPSDFMPVAPAPVDWDASYDAMAAAFPGK